MKGKYNCPCCGYKTLHYEPLVRMIYAKYAFGKMIWSNLMTLIMREERMLNPLGSIRDNSYWGESIASLKILMSVLLEVVKLSEERLLTCGSDLDP